MSPGRVKRQTVLPTICPTESQIIDAQGRFNGLGLAIDARLEAEGFRNYHAAKASRFGSWPHAWAIWVANAIKFQRQRGVGGGRSGRQSPTATRFAIEGLA